MSENLNENINGLLNYRGHNVYASSVRPVTTKVLQNSKSGEGIIFDAFFYKKKENGTFEKVEFNKKKVESLDSGLMIGIEFKSGGRSFIDLQSLDYIDSFLSEAEVSSDNLEPLKNKDAIYYAVNWRLLGFYLKK